MSKSISVSDDTYKILMFMKGRIQMETGKTVSIDGVIHYLAAFYMRVEDILKMVKEERDIRD